MKNTDRDKSAVLNVAYDEYGAVELLDRDLQEVVVAGLTIPLGDAAENSFCGNPNCGNQTCNNNYCFEIGAPANLLCLGSIPPLGLYGNTACIPRLN